MMHAKRIKRGVVLALSMAVSSAMLTACGGEKPVKTAETETELDVRVTEEEKTTTGGNDFSDMLGEQPDGTYGGMSATPGEIYEVAGHWSLTDTLFLDPTETEFSDGGKTLSMSRAGDPEDIVFSYTSDGKSISYTVDTSRFAEKYYTVNDIVTTDLFVKPDPETDEMIGDIIISYSFADVQIGDDGASYTLDNVVPLTGGEEELSNYAIKKLTYNPNYKEYMWYCIDGYFQDGQTDGEMRFLVVEAWDADHDGSRFANIYEYTWADEPETLETEPEYGPIEYF